MNCPKCGKELPEGVNTCPDCTASPSKPLKKGKYLKEIASKGTKATVIVTWLIALVCIGLIFAGAWMSLTIPIADSPSVNYAKKVVASKDDIIEEFETFLKDDELYNYAETSYKENLASLTEEEKVLAETGLAECREFVDCPNVLNMRSFYIAVLDCVEHDNPASQAYAKMYDYADNYGTLIVTIFNAIIVGIAVLAVLCALFILVSAKTKNIVLVILSMLLNVALQVIVLGIPLAVGTAVAHIVLIVVICIINGSYRKYRKSL